MFDQYTIDPATLRNIGPDDAPTGFAFESKLGYYRGLTLSMLEELTVAIDGTELPREAVTFDEGKGPITLDQMETAYDRRWPFGQPATIAVAYPGGFPKGEHRLSLRQRLRVSYMPFPSIRFTEKHVSL
ncbi:DUF6379 domain-containing protein [Sphingomonas sp.]|uniref:C-glycoside deglycosidase beta subunit domain-containing protein n=1 Tax=Sphingomonas sp. TaxID=28214 RepID=UPI001ECFB0E4|nr:DUF6379 domain-containing protein [Sphingomonas sp.]MBX3592855.1 hypothetical protein [Sphingomonas sp.]